MRKYSFSYFRKEKKTILDNCKNAFAKLYCVLLEFKPFLLVCKCKHKNSTRCKYKLYIGCSGIVNNTTHQVSTSITLQYNIYKYLQLWSIGIYIILQHVSYFNIWLHFLVTSFYFTVEHMGWYLTLWRQ